LIGQTHEVKARKSVLHSSRRLMPQSGPLRTVSQGFLTNVTEALKYHSDGYTEADITVQVCWDADRLDLGRVGIKPAPHRLCTASAKSVDVLEAAYERSTTTEKN